MEMLCKHVLSVTVVFIISSTLGRPGFCFGVIPINIRLISSHDLSEKFWVIVSRIQQILCNFKTELFILLRHQPGHMICCNTFRSKMFRQNPRTPKSVEFADLLILALAAVGFRILPSASVQHFRVFCLLKTLHNVDHFQRISNYLYSFCIICVILTEPSPTTLLFFLIVPRTNAHVLRKI